MNYDLIIAGDWRLEGGICTAVDHEIRALKSAGYKIGLLPVGTHFKTGSYPIDARLARHIRLGNAELVSNARSSARVLCVRHPAAIPDTVRKCASLSVGHVYIVVDKPPVDGHNNEVYEVTELHSLIEEATSAKVEWAPISPVCRENLTKRFPALPVSKFDWINFVFVEEWQADRSRPVAATPIIGRHSRPSYEKFPDNRTLLFAAYPRSPEYRVRFLGAGKSLQELAQRWPSNWEVLGWNEVAPQQFLKTIDFFVYFHHSAWVEGFGRAILEALASGCVAIIPPYLEKTFGKAAIYASPQQVKSIVKNLHRDWKKFRQQSARAKRWVQRHHSAEQFLKMIKKIFGSAAKTKSKPRAQSKAKKEPLAQKHKKAARVSHIRTGLARRSRSVGKRSETLSSVEVFANVPSKSTAVVATDIENATKQSLPLLQTNPDRPASEASDFCPSSFEPFDIVYIIDIADVGDVCERVAEESRIAQAHGARVGLALCGENPFDSGIEHPFLNGRHIDSFDLILDHNRWIGAHLAIVVSPRLPSKHFPLRILAKRVLAIADQGYRGDAAKDDAVLNQIFGVPICWSATTEATLNLLKAAVQCEDESWPSSVASLQRTPRGDGKFVIGYVCSPDHRSWPLSQEVQRLLPKGDQCVVYILDAPSPPLPDAMDQVVLFDRDKISLRRFVAKLDALAFYPASESAELPLTAISLALTAGVPIFLPRRYADQINRGPYFVEAAAVGEILGGLLRARNSGAIHREARIRVGEKNLGPQQFRKRLTEYNVQLAKPSVAVARNRLIFLSANGVGLGHITRQLSIARRLSKAVEPVFVSFSQGLQIVRQFGYMAEYIPSLSYTKSDTEEWNNWLEYELGRHIDFYGAGAVAYDGNAPSDGLLRATAARPGVKSCWIRRAMWQQSHSPLIDLQKYFDMVLEPGEIASEADKGATVSARPFVRPIPPIRLLDSSDLLPREEAAQRIGLDPARPAVLISLGAGSTRDNLNLIDQLMPALASVSGLQIAIAEWRTTDDFLHVWPNTTVIRGFPLSQYFEAFDFSISAAGYNSFSEIISFGLPTVFIPNSHPSMDDQRGRAEFAEKHGAAIVLAESEVSSIAKVLPLLLAERSREFLKLNCRRLALENGAEEAARLLETLLIGN